MLVSGSVIGEHLRVQDVVGILLLSGGVIALALAQRSVGPQPAGRHGPATLFAVLTGVTIAAYIIVDGLGVRSAGPTLQHRLAYIAWLYVLDGPWLLLLALWLRPAKGMVASTQKLVARRGRRSDLQCQLRNCDLRPGIGADGACRGAA
jgi:drug/metabolite transporter (DMT)-like permease